MKTQNNIISRFTKIGLLIFALAFSFTFSFAGEYPANKNKIDAVIEVDMKIEKWMSNLEAWKSIEGASQEIYMIEEQMEIENWMLEANSTNWKYDTVDMESELEIEDWMLDASTENWEENTEEEIEVESWMTNLSEWK